jgi:hypothetical protein
MKCPPGKMESETAMTVLGLAWRGGFVGTDDLRHGVMIGLFRG